VLNRLAERGLLRRTPGEAARGPTARITYRPAIREEDYFEQSLEQALAGASREARRVAVTRLAGRIADEETRGGGDAGEPEHAMTVALLLAAAIALPHALRLERASPPIAIVIWASVLSLRALVGALVALWLLFFFPATDVFAAITRWCLHDVLPGHVNGHDVGHAATLVPSLAIAASLTSVLAGTWRLGRRLQRVVSGALGGPAGSRIIGGRDVLLAAVGMRRPQVLVSAGALIALDDDELAAGLAHERGHIARRHRYVLVYAELCRALGRVVPGTRRAAAELSFTSSATRTGGLWRTVSSGVRSPRRSTKPPVRSCVGAGSSWRSAAMRLRSASASSLITRRAIPRCARRSVGAWRRRWRLWRASLPSPCPR
jgi:Zn-dependent protease with chaperone function